MAVPVTVLDGMIAIGLDKTVQAVGTSPAQRVARDIYSNSFVTCVDLTDDEIDSAMKTFSNLAINEGRVRAPPGIVKGLKAFTQFICHQIRMGIDPDAVAFDAANIVVYTRQRATQKAFEKDASDLASEAKPTNFTTAIKWIDWIKTLWNYLRLIPSRDKVPSCYVIRIQDTLDRTPQPDFLDTCVNAAPLTGAAHDSDNTKVFTILKKLVEGNTEAELIVLEFESTTDGRGAVKALRLHYEGVGIHSITRAEATHAIEKMCYSGEKPPHNTWAAFEARLKAAYINYDKIDGRIPPDMAHKNTTRLSKLIENVRPDFLKPVKAQIAVQMNMLRLPGQPEYSFAMALAAMRQAASEHYGPNINRATQLTKRTVNEVSGQKGKQNNNKGNHNAKLNGYKHKNQVKVKRSDGKAVRLKNGIIRNNYG